MNSSITRAVIVAPAAQRRVPVLSCVDELQSRGVAATVRDAESDIDIDAVLTEIFGPARHDEEPSYQDDCALIIAGTDGVVRAVLRRALKRVLPAPSSRPAWLLPSRTIGDLPPVALLSLDTVDTPSLTQSLALPKTPAEVATAVLSGQLSKKDLLRNDHGSLTLHGVMLGQTDQHNRALTWQAEVFVDEVPLAQSSEPLLACAISNAPGYGDLSGLPLLSNVDAGDGVVDVAVALPRKDTIEVRRTTGRAVSVAPIGDAMCTDDGVDTTLTRKKTWWIEPAAWSVFVH